jgi:hypothetical protein
MLGSGSAAKHEALHDHAADHECDEYTDADHDQDTTKHTGSSFIHDVALILGHGRYSGG